MYWYVARSALLQDDLQGKKECRSGYVSTLYIASGPMHQYLKAYVPLVCEGQGLAEKEVLENSLSTRALAFALYKMKTAYPSLTHFATFSVSSPTSKRWLSLSLSFSLSLLTGTLLRSPSLCISLATSLSLSLLTASLSLLEVWRSFYKAHTKAAVQCISMSIYSIYSTVSQHSSTRTHSSCISCL